MKDAIVARMDGGETAQSIALSLGVTAQTLAYHRQRWGLPKRGPAYAEGTQHHAWRGGSFIDRHGYRMIRTAGRETANPYVPEHMLVAEEKLGRRLRRDEVVHHMNCIKLDNRPDNLLVMTRKAHRALHAQLEAIASELVTEGAIVFRDGGYHRAA